MTPECSRIIKKIVSLLVELFLILIVLWFGILNDCFHFYSWAPLVRCYSHTSFINVHVVYNLFNETSFPKTNRNQKPILNISNYLRTDVIMFGNSLLIILPSAMWRNWKVCSDFLNCFSEYLVYLIFQNRLLPAFALAVRFLNTSYQSNKADYF